MSRVIFLDIDGVLNSSAWFDRNPVPPGPLVLTDHLDPAAVAVLDEVVRLSEARLVVSSTWRILETLPDIESALRARGYAGPPIVGSTPTDVSRRLPDGSVFFAERGHEIQAWMDVHGRPDHALIVDDGSDMLHLAHLLLRTDFATGLLPSHLPRALEILGGWLPHTSWTPGVQPGSASC